MDHLFNEHTEEDYNANNDINVFKEARELLNKRRSNLLHKETNKISKKLYKKKAIYNPVKEKEQEDSLTKSEKRELKKIDRYLKKYQYNITHGLDYLCNKEEDYYKPTEVKGALDGS